MRVRKDNKELKQKIRGFYTARARARTPDVICRMFASCKFSNIEKTGGVFITHARGHYFSTANEGKEKGGRIRDRRKEEKKKEEEKEEKEERKKERENDIERRGISRTSDRS